MSNEELREAPYQMSTSDYMTKYEWDNIALFGNISNATSHEDVSLERDLWREIPLGIILTFLCLLTTAGNAMVLHAVRTERRLQSVSTLMIYLVSVIHYWIMYWKVIWVAQ